jgi:hypothetical protein
VAAGMQVVEREEDWTDADEADVPSQAQSPDEELIPRSGGEAAAADDPLGAKPATGKRRRKGAACYECGDIHQT